MGKRKQKTMWASFLLVFLVAASLLFPLYKVQAQTIPAGCPGSTIQGPLRGGTIVTCPQTTGGTCTIVIGGVNGCTTGTTDSANAALLLNNDLIKKGIFKWVNAAVIQGIFTGTDGKQIVLNFIGPQSTMDRDGGRAKSYKVQNYTCDGVFEATPYSLGTEGTLDLDYKTSTVNEGCKDTQGNKLTFPIQSPANRIIAYYFTDNDHMVRVDHNSSWNFTRDTSVPAIPNAFLRDTEKSSNDSCIDRIIWHPGNKIAVYELDKNAGNKDVPAEAQAGSCKLNNYNHAMQDASDGGYLIVGAVDDQAQKAAATAVDNSGATATANSVGHASKCTKSWTNPLTWIICPIISAAAEGASTLDSAIQSALSTNVDQFDETSGNGQALFQSWSIFRNIAWVILAIILLIAIISQAIGVGPFDAYTIKKVIPRVVVAVILVSLSWYLCKMFIEFTNALGAGIKNILYAPFGGSGVVEKINLDLSGATDNGVTFLAAGGLVTLSVLGGFGVLLVSLLMALFAAFIGYLIIIARNIAIIALVVVAPIAIIMGILPNTKKYADYWWDAFSKALLMYPLIIGMIAIGKVFGYITLSRASGGTNPLHDLGLVIVGLVAFFGPYFLIPKTFALAGGLVARVAGIANDRSRGVFDRGKKYRQETTGENFKAMQENRRFNEHKYAPKSLRGRASRRFNSGFSKLTSNPFDVAKMAMGTAGGKAKMSEIDAAKFTATQQLSDSMGKKYGISNDRALKTLAGRRFGKIRTSKDLENAIAGLRATGDAQDSIGAAQLQNAHSLLNDLNSDPELGRANLEGAALMGWASQGFAEANDIASVANDIGGGVGASIQNQASYLSYKMGGRLDHKPTYGVQADAQGNFYDGLSLTNADGSAKEGVALDTAVQSQAKLISSLKQHEITSAKPGAVKNMRAGATRILEDALPENLARSKQQWIRNGGTEAEFDTYASEAKGKAKAMLQNIALSGSATSSADPESKRLWQELQQQLVDNNIVSVDEMNNVKRSVMDRGDDITAGDDGANFGGTPGPRIR